MTLNQEILIKFLKFCVVGSISFVVDFGSTWFFKEKIKINKFVANGIGYMIAVVVNYTLNRLWTFNSHDDDIASQFLKFFTIALFALILNTVIVYVLNAKFRINFYISKLIAVFVVMFYNFGMNVYFTFVK